MMSEGGPADRYVSDFDIGKEPARLKVHVLPVHIVVPGKFGMDVGESVWRSGLIGSIQLRSQCRVEGKRENNFPGSYKLVRVLHGNAPLELVSEVVNGAEFSRTGVRKTDVGLSVLADWRENVSGRRREPNAVRSLYSPGLTTQKFPLATLEVKPIEAQTIGVRVGADENVGGIVAVEVAFKIANHVVCAILTGNLQVVTRILAGGAESRKMPLDSIAERNRAKGRGGAAARVGGAENVLKVHEAARREIRAADAERQWRFFRLFGFLHHSGFYRQRCSAHRGIGHVRRARRLVFQLLLKNLDLLLLLGNLFLLLADC